MASAGSSGAGSTGAGAAAGLCEGDAGAAAGLCEGESGLLAVLRRGCGVHWQVEGRSISSISRRLRSWNRGWFFCPRLPEESSDMTVQGGSRAGFAKVQLPCRSMA